MNREIPDFDFENDGEFIEVRKERRSASNFDRQAAMIDYVFGWVESDGSTYLPTLRDIADKYNVPIEVCSKVSSKSKWRDIRTAVSAKLDHNKNIESIKQILSISATFDARALESIEKCHNITNHYLEKLSDKMQGIEDLEELEKTNIPKNMKLLVDSLEKVVKLNHTILGDKDKNQSLYEDLEVLQEEMYREISSNKKEDNIKELEGDLQKLMRERDAVTNKYKLGQAEEAEKKDPRGRKSTRNIIKKRN